MPAWCNYLPIMKQRKQTVRTRKTGAKDNRSTYVCIVNANEEELIERKEICWSRVSYQTALLMYEK